MTRKPDITRRDFLNGMALSLVAGGTVSPLELMAMSRNAAGYPPALAGLRGSHPGSFEVAHALAVLHEVVGQVFGHAFGQCRHKRAKPVVGDFAHFVQQVVVEHGGVTRVTADWSGGVSKNPLLFVKFKGGAKGDMVKVTWTDNQGGSDSATAGAAGGHSAAGRALPAQVAPCLPEAHPGAVGQGAGAMPELPLARQYPRTGKYHRIWLHSLSWRFDPGISSTRLVPPRGIGRQSRERTAKRWAQSGRD